MVKVDEKQVMIERHYYFRKILDYLLVLAEDAEEDHDFDRWEFRPDQDIGHEDIKFSLDDDIIITKSNIRQYIMYTDRRISDIGVENALKDLQHHGILVPNVVLAHAKSKDIEYRVSPEHLHKQVITVGPQTHSSLYVNGKAETLEVKASLKDEINDRLMKVYGDDQAAKDILDMLLRTGGLISAFSVSYLYCKLRKEHPHVSDIEETTARLHGDNILVKKEHSAIGNIYGITRVVYPFEQIKALIGADKDRPIIDITPSVLGH